MWQCKRCSIRESSGYKLLKHCRLHHHYGPNQCYLCIYVNCPCTFKTWCGLQTHVYRCHSSHFKQTAVSSVTFRCKLCDCSDLTTERDYFGHIGSHLWNSEYYRLLFQDKYLWYISHKKRKHHLNSLKDFKVGLVVCVDPAQNSDDPEVGVGDINNIR